MSRIGPTVVGRSRVYSSSPCMMLRPSLPISAARGIERAVRHRQEAGQRVRHVHLIAAVQRVEPIDGRARRHEHDRVAPHPHPAAEDEIGAVEVALGERRVPDPFADPVVADLDSGTYEHRDLVRRRDAGRQPGQRRPRRQRHRPQSHPVTLGPPPDLLPTRSAQAPLSNESDRPRALLRRLA